MFEPAGSRLTAERIEDDLRDFGIVEEWTAAQAIPGYSNSSATSASTPFHSKCPVGDATVELRCPPERLPRFSHSSRARPARGKPAGSNVQPGKTAGLTRPSSRLWKVHVASVDQIFKPGKQRFDIGIETIGCKAGAGGTLDTKSAKQRLGAVVAGARANAPGIAQGAGDHVRQDVGEGETDRPGRPGRLAQQAHAADRL